MKRTNYILAALMLLLLGTTAFAQIPSYVPTNGLVGWWPFNGNANDESGNGNNGTVNGPILTADRFGNPGKAYDFDGVDDYVNCGNSNSLNPSALSISVWINQRSIPLNTNLQQTILGKTAFFNGEVGYRIITDFDSKNYFIWAPDGTGNDFTNTTTNLFANNWVNILSVRTGDTLRIYKNGLLENQLVYPRNSLNNNNPLLIGAVRDPFITSPYLTRFYDGFIDDIGIWNRALTPCEIRALYLSSTQLYASADTLTTCSSYIWPVTGQTYTQSGTYTDTLQSVQGCDSIVGLELTILQPTAATLAETACGSYTLNGQNYSQSGNYTQTLTNAAGCDSTLTLNLTITNLSAAVSFAGGTLTASPAGATYQWVNCELGYQPIVGSTGQTYTPDSTGNYAVVVTSGPCTDTSACTSVIVVGVENELQRVISLYPNPTDGLLNITDLPTGSKYLLMDAQGRKIMKGSGSGSLTLDLSSLPAGVYTLGVEAQGGKQHLKVVVEK